MRKQEEKQVIEIKEEVTIGEVILEAGDRIEVLKEKVSSIISTEQFLNNITDESTKVNFVTVYGIGRFDVKFPEVQAKELMGQGISISTFSSDGQNIWEFDIKNIKEVEKIWMSGIYIQYNVDFGNGVSTLIGVEEKR